MFEEMLSDRRIKYLFIGLFVIAFALIIYIVWIPKNASVLEISKYTQYDTTSANEELGKKYVKEILSYIKQNNKEALKSVINESYLNAEGITADDCISRLSQKGLLVYDTVASDLTSVTCGENVFYSFYITRSGVKERVNVFETYPYEIAVSFGEPIIYTQLDISEVSQGVRIQITDMIVKSNQITYKVKCTNLTDNNVVIDTGSSSSVVVATDTGNVYTLVSGAGSTRNTVLKKDSSIIITLDYTVAMSEAFNIYKMSFVDVYVNDTKVMAQISW